MKKITDRDCVPVMLGTWAWGDKLSFGGEYPEEELSVLFNRAVLEGFKMWDTAYVYGYGKSEGILGSFLREMDPDDYLLSDKFTPYHAKDFPEDPVRLMAEESLKNLGDFFVELFVFVIVALPYLIPLGLVITGVIFLIRRSNKKKNKNKDA